MPPEASTKSPFFAVLASVNAPFTWPKSSLSRSASGSAAQLTATSGPVARRLRAWTARATSSFPLPLSPVTRTVASVGATRATRSKTRCIGALSPTKPSKPSRASRSWRSRRTSSSRRDCLSARSSERASWSGANGLVRKSKAPARRVAIAVSMLPKPVTTITGVRGWFWTTRSHSSIPFMPFMFRSVTTASKLSSWRRA